MPITPCSTIYTLLHAHQSYAWWMDEAEFYVGYDPVTMNSFQGEILDIFIDPQTVKMSGG